MRRLWLWYVPLAASALAVATFAWGFAAWIRGDTGTPVELGIREQTVPAQPARAIAPIILGDSMARGAGDPAGLGIGGRLDEELQKRGVEARRTWNIAVNGARTTDLLALLERENVRALIRQSNVVILSIAGNDLWGRQDWRTSPPPELDQVMNPVLGRVEEVIERIRGINAGARIFFIGLYNPFVDTEGGGALSQYVNRWNGRLLERFGDDPDFTLVQTSDLFSHRDRLALDRFHPGAEAYELIARRIAESL